MFESHFGLRENPFASGHQPRFVYPSPEHEEALAHLRYGIENLEPFVLITGEVGTGKTTALFEALSGLQSRFSVALITNSALTRSELLEEICLRFGFALSAPVTKPQAMAQLERHLLALRGRSERALLVLDEAQNLDRELLEEVRLLSNLEAGGEKLLQIFLVGQPELEARLSRPELRQLRQRIAVHYRLRPLGPGDTGRYIHHRVTVAGGDASRVFPPDTCAEVHAVTNGIPREINQICAQAILDAYVDGSPGVRPEHVRSAASEAAFQSVLPAAETDPRLPPPLAWPAAVPPPQFAPRAEPLAPQPGTEAPRWEVPVSSLAMPLEPATPAPGGAPPAASVPVPAIASAEALPAGAPAPTAPTPTAPAPDEGRGLEVSPSPVVTSGGQTAGRRPGGTAPPRLYERLRDAEPSPASNTGIKWLIVGAALAVIIVGAVLVGRFGPWAKHQPPTPVPGFAALPADTLPGAAADTVLAAQDRMLTPPDTSPAMPPAAAHRDTGITAPAGATTPVPTPPAVGAPTKPITDAGAPRPTSVQQFGIIVGTYLERSRAEAEVARVTGASGLAGRLVEVRQEGVTMYAVVIGQFPGRDEAEHKASDLIARGTVDEARIISRTVAARP